MNNTPRRVVLKPRIAIFAYLRNLKAPIQTHFLKHYHDTKIYVVTYINNEVN